MTFSGGVAATSNVLVLRLCSCNSVLSIGFVLIAFVLNDSSSR